MRTLVKNFSRCLDQTSEWWWQGVAQMLNHSGGQVHQSHVRYRLMPHGSPAGSFTEQSNASVTYNSRENARALACNVNESTSETRKLK